MCSASDDILLVSSNAQRQIYQVLVAKDGVGLVGSVSELVAYPDGTDKVISMTVNNGCLYFSSEGHGGGLFQVNLGSSLVSCLITATEQCEVHGVAVTNNNNNKQQPLFFYFLFLLISYMYFTINKRRKGYWRPVITIGLKVPDRQLHSQLAKYGR